MGSTIPVGSDDGDGNAGRGAAHEATATDPRPHLAEGRYLLQERLGGGGTADVYRALDTRLNRSVALKIFRPGAGTSAEHRFREEAQLLGPLEHPCLVTVYDAAVENGRAYVVLQLIDGVTLASRLAQGPLSPKQVVEVGARLADVLAYVHSKGIVHRDVKPSNVLVDEANVYLADFGISRLLTAKHNTASGLAVGTAAYMAPEQVRGLRVGPAADIYSLGLVLLECLTGRVEYPGSTVEAAIARLSRRPRISAGLPAPLRHVLCAMTETDPERRPTAARCATALAQARAVLQAPPQAAGSSQAADTSQAGTTPQAAETSGPPDDVPTFARRFASRAAQRPTGDRPGSKHAATELEVAENAADGAAGIAGSSGGRHSAPVDEPHAQTSSARAARLAASIPFTPADRAHSDTASAEPERSAAEPAATPGGGATGLTTGRRRFVRGRRRAESTCLTTRLAQSAGSTLRERLGIRGRIGLGVALALVAVFAASFAGTPVSQISSAGRPVPAAPPAPVPPPTAEAPDPTGTLPTPTEIEAPVPPVSPPPSAIEQSPPASPTPSTSPSGEVDGQPLPSTSIGVPPLLGSDDDATESDDQVVGDDAEDDDDKDEKAKKPKKTVLAKLTLFAWFLALLAD